MSAITATYDAELTRFVEQYRRHLLSIYNLRQDSLSNSEIAIAIEYSCGLEIKDTFERTGRIGLEALGALVAKPVKDRTLDAVCKALRAHEAGLVTNVTLQDTNSRPFVYSPLVRDNISEFRKGRRDKAFRKLAQSALGIMKNTYGLITALKTHKKVDSAESKIKVRVAANALKKSLMDSHRQARLATTWALREGYTSPLVTKGVKRLYIAPMKQLEKRLLSLDKLMAERGLGANLCEGIERRRRILQRELMLSHLEEPMYAGDPKPIQVQHSREMRLEH
ncbi:hypothetical protein ACYPKM_03410 [Pseudomonas aeruginosa]